MLSQGVRNANDGLSDLQIKDSAMANISTLLDRLSTLATTSPLPAAGEGWQRDARNGALVGMAAGLTVDADRIEALGEAMIVPVLFKHAQTLTRTFGGNAEAPEFAAWKPKARKAAKTASRSGAPAAKSRAAAR